MLLTRSMRKFLMLCEDQIERVIFGFIICSYLLKCYVSMICYCILSTSVYMIKLVKSYLS